MSKTKMTPIPVKANGVRNELKEIRKSIDTLTHALHIMIETQTNKHEKTNSSVDVVDDWMHIKADYD